MTDSPGILQGEMSLFLLINGFFSLSVSAWLCHLFSTKRYLFIKPSILLILYTHVFLQWPVTLFSGYYEFFLPDPLVFVFMIHGFTVIGLLVSSYTFREPSRQAWLKMTGPSANIRIRLFVVLALLAMISLITAFYLRHVPFGQTGLYAIFQNPAEADVIRERSLKLLDNPPVQYTFAFMSKALAPLLTALLTLRLEQVFRDRAYSPLFWIVPSMAWVAFSVSLTGERVALVNLLLVIASVLLLRRGIPLRLKHLPVLTIVLLPAVLLSILLESKELSASHILDYFGHIGKRAFVAPLDVCSWYAHYVQTHSTFGIAGIPKLAALAGVQPIDVQNLVGIEYVNPSRLTSISAGAAYLITYYSLFGAISLVGSLIGLYLLDVAAVVYRYLDEAMLLACAASLTMSTLSFIQTNYTTVWVTHGFGLILLISFMASTRIPRASNLEPGRPART
jgi:hypothetical protein